ncbi:flavin reductase family protein [Symmachiella dynata]|uniref:flavin reductase family protein n=1 Tax=Symmachiella dynata TaxID=2527995 RepID=UPI0030ED176C|tara:strand:- start:199 stop:693 length:495 start_codon:yes stop_codon:yes gene_type:complete
MADEKNSDLAQVLGRIPSGVFILTCGDDNGNTTGMLASWVQQAAFEPPMISVVVKEGRYVNDWLGQTGRAVVNVVSESQKQLLGHFGRGFEPDQPAFEGLEITTGETGLPILTDGLGYLEGEVVESLAAGDHRVYLLKVIAAGSGPRLADEAPMIHIRKNGFNY